MFKYSKCLVHEKILHLYEINFFMVAVKFMTNNNRLPIMIVHLPN